MHIVEDRYCELKSELREIEKEIKRLKEKRENIINWLDGIVEDTNLDRAYIAKLDELGV